MFFSVVERRNKMFLGAGTRCFERRNVMFLSAVEHRNNVFEHRNTMFLSYSLRMTDTGSKQYRCPE
jgi:hypothetical protein